MADLIERIARALRDLFLGPPETSSEHREPPGSAAGPTLITHPPSASAEVLHASPTGDAGSPSRISPGGGREPVAPCHRFLLSVDGAGQTLVVIGDRITIGHLRAGRADLPFLADVGPTHAELVRMESLREGSIWSIRPLEGESVRVEDREVSEAGCLLSAGARIRLGENLDFRVLIPDDASRTVLLEIVSAAECAGAKTVALFGEGEGARLRIGAAANRHIRVPNLEHEISIVARDEKLLVRCEAGVSRSEETTTDVFSLPCPLPQRVDLQIGTSREGRPPFSLALAPAELPGFARRGDGS